MSVRLLEGVDDFLGHSASVSGGAFLKNWKKEDRIDVVLHPRAPIAALWSHRWYRIVPEKKDGKETGKTTVWSDRFNSMEKESILTRQYFRNDDGSREFPPEVCPFSLLIEWVREQIDDEKIGWTDLIFEIKSDREDVEVLAGGFTGLFQSKHLDDDQLEELKEAKVKVNEAYKQNALAQINYVFLVVQYDHPEEGCVIAMEGKGLGKKMQKAISDEKKKWRGTKEADRGDYTKHPYAFRWEYDEKKSFDDKFDVIAMPNDALPITAEIETVLKDPPPKLDKLLEVSNIALLRASFEEHWVHEVVPPWDDLFKAAMDELKGTHAAELPTDFNPENMEPKTEAKSSKKADKTPPLPADVEMVECDTCKKAMAITVFTCPHCGQEYDPETGLRIEKPKEEPPPPPTRTRSQAAAAAKSAASETKPAEDDVAPPRRRSGKS